MARVTLVYAIFPSAVRGKTLRFWCDCIENQRLGPDWTIKKRLVECTLWQINTQFDARMFPWHLISIKLRNLSLRSCFRYTNVHSAQDSHTKKGIAEKKKKVGRWHTWLTLIYSSYPTQTISHNKSSFLADFPLLSCDSEASLIYTQILNIINQLHKRASWGFCLLFEGKNKRERKT